MLPFYHSAGSCSRTKDEAVCSRLKEWLDRHNGEAWCSAGRHSRFSPHVSCCCRENATCTRRRASLVYATNTFYMENNPLFFQAHNE